MYRFSIILLLVMAGFSSLGQASEKKIVAFAQDTLANDFRKAQVFEVRDALAGDADIRFVYSDANGQTSLLIRQIGQFTAQGVDLLIVGTNDERAVVPAVAKAHRSGIPVIILDRGIKGGEYTTFINSDNILIGKLGAEYIAKRLNGKGLVLLFEGIQEADVTQLRSKGFIDEMEKHPGIRIIKRTGNYLRKDALIEMEKLVREGVSVDAIFSESDSMLSGVRMVLNRYGIDPGTIIMVGCDYTSEARQAIRDGTQSGSVLFPLGGTKSVEIGRRILNGEQVPKHIYNPVKLVTGDNVDEVEPIF
ncbi:MAG: LacI family transcriptional regulator [Candidatus Sedimenticola endophacoides]|uniref:LacI family transcriptional regulator n=1 Tax=Candidatus Sedimenticola endophacoides TaxID=2548426 RepID=A0A6N4E796_9GAMM|nr:MAG: LacI family transcriptional regulator [Candidatus Sedimenticola endophacoides]OQX41193.1 MAG: LacI family transcriptional regulator [Candidatus Sedimenticola endophacoides]OQX43968.1 MAG: LacI family transcriptional regulator [Candidatus Sedimenticola endophacoides]PUE05752.1 MAG: LacI family transcriptional regulator [Candidatus Sedimenticola endophacoides]